jgi:hypothetical protein
MHAFPYMHVGGYVYLAMKDGSCLDIFPSCASCVSIVHSNFDMQVKDSRLREIMHLLTCRSLAGLLVYAWLVDRIETELSLCGLGGHWSVIVTVPLEVLR